MNTKPCPFCGASRTVELWSRFDAGHIAHLHCEGCGANGPSLYSEHSAEVAIKLARYSWNGRSQSYRQGDKLKPVR